MSREIKRNIIISITFIAAVIFGLSVFAGIPYIYTACGLSIWAAVGHLVTLDDDMPGEWSNMEHSKEVWRNSKVQLTIKLVIMFFLIVLVMAVPELSIYGKN